MTVFDGSLLRAAPRVVWALWRSRHERAAKMHLGFHVLQGVAWPVHVFAFRAAPLLLQVDFVALPCYTFSREFTALRRRAPPRATRGLAVSPDGPKENMP